MNSDKLVLVLGTAFALLLAVYGFKSMRRKRQSKQTLSPPLQVWEGEGGNIPDVLIPPKVSANNSYINK